MHRIELDGSVFDRSIRLYGLEDFVFLRYYTEEWSFLVQYSTKLCVIDRPSAYFSLIPKFLCVHGSQTMAVSMMSDRLFCLCVAESIAILRFVQRIRSCFRSFKSCAKTMEISPWIESVDGFIQVHGLEIVTFGSESDLREIHGFSVCESLQRIELPESVEIVDGLNHCCSLRNILFRAGSRVWKLHGICYCTSLCDITIPSSVEIVAGFDQCEQFVRVHFESNSQAHEITGFDGCSSLCEFDILAMVTNVTGFSDCPKLHQITFSPNSQLFKLSGFRHCNSLSRMDIPAPVQEILAFDYLNRLQLRLTLAAGRKFVRSGASDE
jgi:hypothetical protein